MQFRNADIVGQRVSIDPVMVRCSEPQGAYRAMVAEAVARILRARGALVDPVKRV